MLKQECGSVTQSPWKANVGKLYTDMINIPEPV